MTTVTWNIGDVVRKLRLARRWTQSVLASNAGLNKATINNIETGGRSLQRSLEWVAAALDVSVAELYRLTPPSSTSASESGPAPYREAEWSIGAGGPVVPDPPPMVLRFDRSVRSPALIMRAIIDPGTLVLESVRIARPAVMTWPNTDDGGRLGDLLPPAFLSDVERHVAAAQMGRSSTMVYSARQKGTVVFRQVDFEPYRNSVAATVTAIPPPDDLLGLTACCGEYDDCATCAQERAAVSPARSSL